MMEWLWQIDLKLFHVINSQYHVPALDNAFELITNLHKRPEVKYFVFPLLLIWWIWRSRMRAVRIILVTSLLVGVSDVLNHRVIKPIIARPRPFQSIEVGADLRLPYQPGGFSFPSNHATNCFAAASMLSAFVPSTAWLLFPYAILVSYSRPYLGVHYPSDILAGMAMGLLLAALAKWLLRRFVPSWAREFAAQRRKTQGD